MSAPPGVQCPVGTDPLVIGVSVSDECPPGVQCPVGTDPLVIGGGLVMDVSVNY